MNDKPTPTYQIHPKNYQWYMDVFARVKARLGVNVKIHGDKSLLHEGDIFLFNHFARFEVAMPPYLIWQETGVHCRSVAHAGLFKVSAALTKFMVDMGAVPHNHPELLPLLAVDILQGRKVMIFPEGGMVKNRRTVDDHGHLAMYKVDDNSFQKMRRGAAVLGVMLQAFKEQILQLDKQHNTEKLEAWRVAVGLDTVAALLKVCGKPTTIIPATITFHPIRPDSNALSNLAETVSSWLGKNLPQKILEEAVVEGNILFRDTDMDIKLDAPMRLHLGWPWWKRKLLDQAFAEVSTMQAWFGIKEHNETVFARTLNTQLGHEIDAVRDDYMERIYTGTMVNRSHVASVLLRTLRMQGVETIEKERFHKILYLAIKGLVAKEDSVALHRSILWPERYRGLLDGTLNGLKRFFEDAVKMELVAVTPTHYVLHEKLASYHDYDNVRTQNAIDVYVNEVAALPVVQEVVNASLKRVDKVTEQDVAEELFADEVRAHARVKAYFNHAKFDDIHQHETARGNNHAPFFLHAPKGKNKRHATGVLLVHGFLASPAEMREFGDECFAAGYPTYGVRLSGHGTSPWDLHRREWQEWLNAVKRGYRILSAYCDKVVIVGFSTGAALSLIYAAEHPAKLAGVASIAAPWRVQQGTEMALVPWMKRLNNMVARLTGSEGVYPFSKAISEHPEVNYQTIPVAALDELNGVMATLHASAANVRTRVMVMQSDNDSVVHPSSATHIYNTLTTPDKLLHVVASARHGIIYENVGETRELLLDFIARCHKEGLV
ncbi:MAG: alpha/beta fold hydrolase [Alphaproteobacteria bacterium]